LAVVGLMLALRGGCAAPPLPPPNPVCAVFGGMKGELQKAPSFGGEKAAAAVKNCLVEDDRSKTTGCERTI
jgi:hypothetical protein